MHENTVEKDIFFKTDNLLCAYIYNLSILCQRGTQITILFPPTMVKSKSSFALLQTYFIIRNNAVHLASPYEFCETLGRSYLKAHTNRYE